MDQKPKIAYTNANDFLEKDRQRLVNEAKAKKEREAVLQAEKLAKLKKEEQRKKEYVEQWESFYSNKGFRVTFSWTWDYGCLFFLSPTEDPAHYYNYVWSDPDYGGDNIIRPFAGTIRDFFKDGWGRDKGRGTAFAFCGDKVGFSPIKMTYADLQQLRFPNRVDLLSTGKV